MPLDVTLVDKQSAAYVSGMRSVLILTLMLGGSPAFAADDECISLAERLDAAHQSFPAVIGETTVPLMTWRASCAENSPDGPGKIVVLCEADTTDGRGVFYWLKQDANGGSLGYRSCI